MGSGFVSARSGVTGLGFGLGDAMSQALWPLARLTPILPQMSNVPRTRQPSAGQQGRHAMPLGSGTGILVYLTPVVLLLASNIFMTIAWYGHLSYKHKPLIVVIVVSWAIAFVEYCLAVPANRYGHAVYSAAELKTMQEVITLAVFSLFSVIYLKEPLSLHHAVGFALIAAGAFFIFSGRA